jgi:hypothetical protein
MYNKFNKSNKHQNYKNKYINNIYVKKLIINYLYSKIDLPNLNYKIIKYDNELNDISDKIKYIQYSYSGSNNFLIFIKIENKYYSVMVEKNTLCYNFSKLDINRVKIIKVNIRFNKKIYDGTIFDGIYLINKFNNEKKFIINDIYYFTGSDMTYHKIKNKFYVLSSFLDINPNTEDNNLENIDIVINNFYKLNEIENIYNTENNELSHFIKGFSFIKETSGKKILYFFNNSKRDNNSKYNNNKYNNNKYNNNKYNNNKYNNNKQRDIFYKDPYTDRNLYKLKEPVQIEDTKKVTKVNIDSKINVVFEIKKTDISDVYELYLLKYNKNTKNIKLKKVSIAYIPTADCSNLCRNIFKDNKNKSRMLVNCSYNFEKKKWVPCSFAKEKKRAEFIHNVMKKINL